MTISELGRKFGLSRSALIYYDKIGLLSPSGRTKANYRIYTEDDVERLERIFLYRRTGVELETIHKLLESPDNAVWEARLIQLNDEMNSIRLQQKMILEIMGNPDEKRISSLFTAEKFTKILTSLGMNEKELFQFHVKMEMNSTEEHKNFLHFLGLDSKESDSIITKTKEAIKNAIED